MFGKKQDTQIDYEIFVMYDSKVGAYDMPMFAINQHDMTREIFNVFKDSNLHSKNKYYLNAEDYSLFKIGGYSKKLGTLVTHQGEHIANMHDIRTAVDLEISKNGTQRYQNPDQVGIGPT